MATGIPQMQSKECSGNPESPSTSLFNITTGGLKMLLERKVDLNGLYMLHLISEGVILQSEDIKIKSWIQHLTRKKLLNQEGAITLKGKALLREVAAGAAEAMITFNKKDDPFEKWWTQAYPATDYFEYRGIVFHGTQAKHIDKEECRRLFWDIVNEGTYSPEDIFWGTVCNMENARELSLTTGRSELHFIANSKRYLQLRKFIPFVEAGRRKYGDNGRTHNSSRNDFDFDI